MPRRQKTITVECKYIRACVCVSVCVCACACIYAYTYVCTCAYKFSETIQVKSINMYIHVYEYTLTCAYVCTYACAYACIYVCVFLCVYTVESPSWADCWKNPRARAKSDCTPRPCLYISPRSAVASELKGVHCTCSI